MKDEKLRELQRDIYRLMEIYEDPPADPDWWPEVWKTQAKAIVERWMGTQYETLAVQQTDAIMRYGNAITKRKAGDGVGSEADPS